MLRIFIAKIRVVLILNFCVKNPSCLMVKIDNSDFCNKNPLFIWKDLTTQILYIWYENFNLRSFSPVWATVTALMVAFFSDFDCWWFKFLPRFWVLWQNDLGAIWHGLMDNLVEYWLSYQICRYNLFSKTSHLILFYGISSWLHVHVYAWVIITRRKANSRTARGLKWERKKYKLIWWTMNNPCSKSLIP